MATPDWNAAEPLALGARGHGSSTGAHDARGPIDITRHDGKVLANLGHFFDGGREDLPLRIEAKSFDPLPVVVQQCASLVEPDPMAIREEIETPLRIDSRIEQRILGVPKSVDCFVIFSSGLRIALDSPWGHDVRVAPLVSQQ